LQKIADLQSADNKPQSVTTRPELGDINGKRVIFVGTGRYLGVNDLTDPAKLTPALPYARQQTFYGIKDADSNWGNFRSATGAKARTFTQTADTIRTVTATGGDVNWSTDAGWYIDFNATDGERVNIDPILVLGTLVITTNIPNQNACTVGGDSWTYFLDYTSGNYVSTSPNQEAGYKRVGFLTVGNVVVRLPSGSLKLISTDITGGKSTRGVPIGASAGIGRRISWRELIK
ncbi:MAG TPA: hypothetical protein VLC55_10665, partial [Burkholderiales bacterium]|nr:hypothetical protein [Burkholderiales bacterium]